MAILGYIRVIKRTGDNGSHFPCYDDCIIGRDDACHIRIYLAQVEDKHCIITGDEHGQCFLTNLSNKCPTLLNGVALGRSKVELGHGDKFTVADRTLRWEYLKDSPFYVKTADNLQISSVGSPGMTNRMVSLPLSVLQNSPSANFPSGIRVGRSSTRLSKSRESVLSSTPSRKSTTVTNTLQGSSPRLIAVVSPQRRSQKLEPEVTELTLQQMSFEEDESFETTKSPEEDESFETDKSRISFPSRKVGDPFRTSFRHSLQAVESIEKQRKSRRKSDSLPSVGKQMSKLVRQSLNKSDEAFTGFKDITPDRTKKSPDNSFSDLLANKNRRSRLSTGLLKYSLTGTVHEVAETMKSSTLTTYATIKTPKSSKSSHVYEVLSSSESVDRLGSPRNFPNFSNSPESKSLKIDKSPRKSLKIDKSPRKSLKIDKSSRKSLKIDNSPRKSLKIDNSPSKSLMIDKSSRKSLKIDKSPRKSLKIDKSPRKSLKIDKSPRKSLKIDKSPRKSLMIDKSPRKSLKIDKSPRKSPKIDKSPRKSPKIDKSPRKFLKIDKSPRKFLKIDKSPRKSLKTDKSPRKSLKIDKSSRKSLKIVKSPRKSLKIDKSPRKSEKTPKISPGKSVKISPASNIKTPLRNTNQSLAVKGSSSRKSVKLVSSKIAKTSVISPSSKKSVSDTPPKMTKTPKPRVSGRKSAKLSTNTPITTPRKPGRSSTSFVPNQKLLSPKTGISEVKVKSGKIFKSHLKTPVKVGKRKLESDVQSAERAAKRLKLSKHPKTPDKKKMAALMLCHGKSPRGQILSKKPLFSEVLKSRLGNKHASPSVVIKRTTVVRGRKPNLPINKTRKIQQPPLSTVVPSTFNFNSTGHANSPETIIIGNRVSTKIPLVTRKGRKSPLFLKPKRKLAKDDAEVFSVKPLFQTPKSLRKLGMTPQPVLFEMSAGSSDSDGTAKSSTSVVSPLSHNSQRKSVRFSPAIVFGRQHRTSPQIGEDSHAVRRSIMKGRDSSSSRESLEHTNVYTEELNCLQRSNLSPRKSSITVIDNINNISNMQGEKECPIVPSGESSRSRKRSGKKSQTSTPSTEILISSPVSGHTSRKRSRSSEDAKDALSPTKKSVSRKLKLSDTPQKSLNRSQNLSSVELSMNTPNSVSAVERNISKKSLSNSRTSVISTSVLVMSTTHTGLNVTDDSSNKRLSTRSHRKGSVVSLSPPSSLTLQSSPRLSVTLESGDGSYRRFKRKDSKGSNASSSGESTPIKMGNKERRTSRSSNESLGSFDINETDFDFSSVNTPQVPREHFVSPLSNSSYSSRKLSTSLSPRLILKKCPNSTELSKLTSSPQNDVIGRKSVDMHGVKQSPKYETRVRGVKKLFTPKTQQSPNNNLTDVGGVKRLLGTPKAQHSPKNDLTDVRGAKGLLGSLKTQRSPKNDLTDVRGVKRLLRTPRLQKSPKNDLTDVRGVKRLLATPKTQHSPKNDLTDVRGVKGLLGSPKTQHSPKNDLTDVRGVKGLLGSPKTRHSPKNDLTDVRGVKGLLGSPKTRLSPKNDLTDVRGVKQLMRSPKTLRSPKNDLTDVRGVKQLMRSPKTRRSPKNDLTDVHGVKRLMRTPSLQNSPKTDLTSVHDMQEVTKIDKSSPTDVVGIKSVQVGEVFVIDSQVKTPPRRGRRDKMPLSDHLKLDAVSPGLGNKAKSKQGIKTAAELKSVEEISTKSELKSVEEISVKPRRGRNAAQKEIISVSEVSEMQGNSGKGRRGKRGAGSKVITVSATSDMENTPVKGRRGKIAAKRTDILSGPSDTPNEDTEIKSKRGRLGVKDVSKLSDEPDTQRTPNRVTRGRAASRKMAKMSNEFNIENPQIKPKRGKAVTSTLAQTVDKSVPHGTPRKPVETGTTIESPSQSNNRGTRTRGIKGRGKTAFERDTSPEKTISPQESKSKRATRRKVQVSIDVPDMEEIKPIRSRRTKQDTVSEAPDVKSNSKPESVTRPATRKGQGVTVLENSPAAASAKISSLQGSKRAHCDDKEEIAPPPTKRRKPVQDEAKEKITAKKKKKKNMSSPLKLSSRSPQDTTNMSKSPMTRRKTRSQR